MTRPLAAILDEGGFGARRLFVVLLCAALGLVDGYDTQAIAFVAPAIQRDWGVNGGDFAPVFAANALGAFCGAVPFGMLSDRMGRRWGTLLGLAVALVGTAASALATTTAGLAASRFVGGIGLGSVLPPLIALTSEYAPARARRLAITAMFSSFPFGAVLGAIIIGSLVGPHNWRGAFWMGAALPAILLPLGIAFLPESIYWLARERRGDAVRSALVRLGATDWDGTLSEPPRSARAPLRELFREGRWPATVFLSAACFASLLLIYLAVYWVPIIAVSAGATLRGGALASAALNIAGIVGGLMIAKIADARGGGSVAIAYGVGAGGLALVSAWTGTIGSVALCVVLIGLFCIGAQMTLLAIASVHYPLDIRTTGVALVSAVGRLGAVAGPLLGGVIAGSGEPARGFALTVAAAAAIAGACVAVAETRSRRAKP